MWRFLRALDPLSLIIIIDLLFDVCDLLTGGNGDER